MSAIYQNEVIELTSQDLQTLEQELNPNDDTQQLVVINEDEAYLDRLLSRWEECVFDGKVPGIEFSDSELDSIVDYCLTEEEEDEWLQYEQGRLESAIEESQNEW
jgi:hypothetical protein